LIPDTADASDSLYLCGYPLHAAAHRISRYAFQAGQVDNGYFLTKMQPGQPSRIVIEIWQRAGGIQETPTRQPPAQPVNARP